MESVVGNRTKPTLLMLSPVLPYSNPDNAGGRYVQQVVQALQDQFEIIVLAPVGPAAERSRESGDVPRHILLGHPGRGRLARVQEVLSRSLPLLMPVAPTWRYMRDLLAVRESRELIRAADVIDLQWEEQGVLIPILRRLNPNAHIVCTFHDVLSQRYGRAQESAGSVTRRLRWAWATAIARRAESMITARSDVSVVLSEKDAKILPSGDTNVRVVDPPVVAELADVDRSSPQRAELLFVAYLARWENEQGLLWFLENVWPLIKASVPEARFRVAGLGIRENVVRAAQSAGIELLGFVPDLGPLYEEASVVAVPLRLGAGVKFKVIDALLAGVPVVTTPIGAEGIGDSTWFAGVKENPEEFARAVLDVLRDPVTAGERSAAVRKEIKRVYGLDAFDEKIRAIYKIAISSLQN